MTQKSRIDSLREAFVQHFHEQPELIVRAPGRVNLIGEHTDYNEGFVFPVAIDREMLIAATLNHTDKVLAYSLDYNQMDSFDINSITRSAGNPWADYLRAVISTLRKRKFAVTGFSAVLSGNVPQGAGLSSSAAYEVAVATLCKQFDKLPISGKEIALIAQQAENEFIGVQCGIMDQFISALAEEDCALMIDCRSLDYRAVPLKLSAKGCAIVITNSGVRRGLVDSEYNARRGECSEGVKLLSQSMGKKLNSLRDVQVSDLESFSATLPEVVLKRCRHVITENKRVLDAVSALESGDLVGFGKLMNESHQSLRDDFAVSCAELDQLVELSQNHPGVLGARMTGAGFGGCTVAIVAKDAIESFREQVIPEYEKQSGKKAEVYVCNSTAGAGAITAIPAG